ncbi:SpoIIE family protein phosphatase [Streptomyces sp. NPDC002328]|uniref:ATP-binding SpoIIE family protein phosphatase n=1 Tax=Streptomyces sp. NPDC002328 TaxID=3364642 RepID=UPI0036C8E4FE
MGALSLPHDDGAQGLLHDDARVDPFGLSAVALLVVDADGLVEYWSAAAEDLLGYAAADVLRRPVASLLGGEVVAAALRRGPTGDDRWAGRVSVCHRAGHQVELALRVRALPAGDGREGWLAAVCAATRVNDWDLHQAAMRGLLDRSPIGVAVLDADLRCRWANDLLAGMEDLQPSQQRHALLRPADGDGGGISGSGSGSGSGGAAMPPAVERQARQALAVGETVSSFEHVTPPSGSRRRGPARLRLRSSVPLRDRFGVAFGVCQSAVDFDDQDRARQRLLLVNEASERIGTTLDLERTVAELAEILVPRVADFAAVDLLDDVLAGADPVPPRHRGGQDGLSRAAHLSIRADHPEVVVEIGAATRYPAQSPQSRSLATGRAVRTAAVTPSTRWLSDDPLRQSPFVRIGVHSHMVVPLRARGVTAGVVTLLRWENPDPFDEDDLLLVEELSARAAVCVDNARRFAREHSAALALQTSLLPPALPHHTAVEVAYRYLPADAEAGVGGDWFDVIPLSGARVALVVGDVVGHGIHAAASMGRLRAAVQTLADMDLPPEELLAHVDDLVLRLAEEAEASAEGPVVVGATCVYAVYDPIVHKLCAARAGHPSPGIAHMREPVGFLDVPAGPPLGLGGLPFESAEIDLEEGSVLAFFTDGLIEAHDHDVDTGLERLSFALAHPDRPLEEICETMVRTLLPDRPRDDVAFLVVRTRTLSPDRVASWEFTPTPSAVPEARRRATAQLTRWGLADLAFTTELIVSELITNAVRHARGPVSLRLIHERALTCEVSDASNTSPRMRRARYTDEGGRGLFLVAQVAQRWGTRYTPKGKTIWTEQSLP